MSAAAALAALAPSREDVGFRPSTFGRSGPARLRAGCGRPITIGNPTHALLRQTDSVALREHRDHPAPVYS